MAHQNITYPEKVSDLKLLGPEMSLRLLVTKKCTEFSSFDLHRATTGKLKNKKSISGKTASLLEWVARWVRSNMD